MAKTKKPEPAEKSGRALVDIDALGLKSGDYATILASDADLYESVGMFDTRAEK